MVMLDNIGLMLAGLFRQPSQGAKSVTGLKRQSNGTSFGTGIYQTSTNSTNAFVVAVNQTQVGKGNTPVSRSNDFAIETPFGTSPLSAKNNSLSSGYNSGLGKIEIPTLISPTAEIGNVSEIIHVISVRDNLGGSVNVPMTVSRDVITPVGFIIGQSLNVTHEVLI